MRRLYRVPPAISAALEPLALRSPHLRTARMCACLASTHLGRDFRPVELAPPASMLLPYFSPRVCSATQDLLPLLGARQHVSNASWVQQLHQADLVAANLVRLVHTHPQWLLESAWVARRVPTRLL